MAATNDLEALRATFVLHADHNVRGLRVIFLCLSGATALVLAAGGGAAGPSSMSSVEGEFC